MIIKNIQKEYKHKFWASSVSPFQTFFFLCIWCKTENRKDNEENYVLSTDLTW